MFKIILEMLKLETHYGISKEIDIAKGINKIPTSINEAWKQGIRNVKTLKYEKNVN